MKQELIDYCQYLTDSMAYNDEIGFYYWPWLKDNNFEPEDCSHCGICTNGARLIAFKFNGYVAGYNIWMSESDMLIGHGCGGHDFAIVGDYIVDWWGWEYSKELFQPVNLKNEVVNEVYKIESSWNTHKFSDYR